MNIRKSVKRREDLFNVVWFMIRILDVYDMVAQKCHKWDVSEKGIEFFNHFFYRQLQKTNDEYTLLHTTGGDNSLIYKTFQTTQYGPKHPLTVKWS